MSSDDLEARLREMLARPADEPTDGLSGPQLRHAAADRATAASASSAGAVQQNNRQTHESSEPTAAGHRDPAKRREPPMPTVEPHADEITILDAPARRARRRLALVSGAALTAAAAAVLAVALTPGTKAGHEATPATGPSAVPAHTSAAHRAVSDYTYVHHTFGSGGYQDVWIPADPTDDVWALKVDAGSQQVTQRAKCAAFPYYQVSQVETSSGLSPKNPVPGCDASAGWLGPYRPPFAESLTTDPHALLADMRRNGDGGTDADAFELGSDFVSSGWVPTDIAANVVAALKLIPGVIETRGVSNHAGATGTEISFTGRIKPTVSETWGVIVDPASGEVIGSTFSYSDKPTEVDGITRTTVHELGATK